MPSCQDWLTTSWSESYTSVKLEETYSVTMTKTKQTTHKYHSKEEEARKRMEGRKRKETEEEEMGDREHRRDT